MTFKIYIQDLPEIKNLVQELVGECIWYVYALLAYEICKMPDFSVLPCAHLTCQTRVQTPSLLSPCQPTKWEIHLLVLVWDLPL